MKRYKEMDFGFGNDLDIPREIGGLIIIEENISWWNNIF